MAANIKAIVQEFWKLDDTFAGNNVGTEDKIKDIIIRILSPEFIIEGDGYKLNFELFEKMFFQNLNLYETVTTLFDSVIEENEEVAFHIKRSITYKPKTVFPNTSYSVGGQTIAFEIIGFAKILSGKIVSMHLRMDDLKRKIEIL